MKILYFSQVSWRWIKQRPNFIAEELAALGHDVTFKAIAPVGTGKITGVSKNLMIKEITGVRGSAKYKLSRFINSILTRIDLADKDYDIVILTYPFQLDFLPDKFRNFIIVYDCMDIVSEFYSDKTSEDMIVKEKKLCRRAEAIIVSSNKIKDTIIKRHEIPETKITLIRNAFDDDRPWLSSSGNTDNNRLPVKSPSMGYMGSIEKWIDFDLLYGFCRKHKELTLYIIGPVGKGIKEKMREAPENIIFTGALEHSTALELMKKIDVALIPFKVTELIKGVDPVKMYEYLSLNKPVVSSYWEELDHFKSGGGIFFYRDPDSFESAVQTAGKYKGKCDISFLRENNWKARAKQFDAVLKQILN